MPKAKAVRYTILLPSGAQDGSFKTHANAEKMRAKCAKLPHDFEKFSPHMQEKLTARAELYSNSVVAPRISLK